MFGVSWHFVVRSMCATASIGSFLFDIYQDGMEMDGMGLARWTKIEVGKLLPIYLSSSLLYSFALSLY